jgi:dipeptidyl aminopeptidase/acylaminoacyl peptidase
VRIGKSNTVVHLFILPLIVSFAYAASFAEQQYPIKQEYLSTVKDFTYNVNLSRNGSWLAYGTKGEVWIVSMKAGSTPRKVAKGTIPIWAPDSTHLAYYGLSAGVNQLWVFNRESGHTEQITDSKGGVDPNMLTGFIGMSSMWHDPLLFSWSPDGTKIVFASQEEDRHSRSKPPKAIAPPGSPLVLTNTTPPSWTIAGLFVGGSPYSIAVNGRIKAPDRILEHRPNQLYIVDVKSRQLKQLTTDDQDYFTPDWSPDGKKIVCASSEGRHLAGFGSGPTNLYLIDLDTGAKSKLTSDTTFYKRLPKWSPDGKWIAFNSEQHGHDEDVSVIPSSGGNAVSLTMPDSSVWQFEWGSDSQSIVFMYQGGITAYISRVDLGTKEVTKLASDPAFRALVGVSIGGTVVWSQSDPKHHGVVYALAPHSSLPSLIFDPNPQIRLWELGEQEVVKWKNSRGDELQGVVVKPTGYQSGHKYPLIIDAYPGMFNEFKATDGMGANHMWAERGYVLFWPVMRAPHFWTNPSNSRAFDEAAKGPKGIDVMTDDIMSGVDELIRRDLVDEQRMGVYGFSNGGAVVSQLITKTGRFKCAVSVAAAASTDWISLFFQFTNYKGIADLAGALPWEDPNRWVELSSIFRLDKVSTPILLAAGDDDLPLRSIEEYNGLRYLGKDVTLLRYPKQGHGFDGPALKDFTERELEFFDKYLKQPN